MFFLQSFIMSLLVCLGISLITSACMNAPVNSGQTSFSDYAKTVFRHQNELTSRLMMLRDEDQLPEDDKIDLNEQEMLDACSLLNEYAERESAHEIISWEFKSKVQSSVEVCDKSIKRLEELLTETKLKD